MAACVMAAAGAMAQGNGQAGITEATQMVTSYFDPGTKLIYAIGGGWIDWRCKSLWKIQQRRSRYVEDGGKLVRSLYFPDCRCYYPALFLPVKEAGYEL